MYAKFLKFIVFCFSTLIFSRLSFGDCATIDASHKTYQVEFELTRSNVFLAQPTLDIVDRQFFALQVLASDRGGNLGPTLRNNARDKIRTYAAPRQNEQLMNSLERSDHFRNQRDALEFVLDSFRSQSDAPLRKAVIGEIGNHLGSDMGTVERLLPLTRGVGNLYDSEPNDANNAIIKITDRKKFQTPMAYVTNRTYRQRLGDENWINLLPSGSIKELKTIGAGNVNTTLLLEFEIPKACTINGVFKPFFGQNGYENVTPSTITHTREIQAFDFYTEFFQHPQIQFPETRELIITTREKAYGVGSFQVFLKGFKTVNEYYGGADGKPVPPASPRYVEVWDRQRQDPRWAKIGPWIAVVDYVLGNTDRFQNTRRTWGNPNNLMVRDIDGGKQLAVGLIDTGNGRRIRPENEFGPNDIPDPETFSEDLIRAVIHAERNIDRIRERYESAVSPDGITDMVTRIQQVREAIRKKLRR